MSNKTPQALAIEALERSKERLLSYRDGQHGKTVAMIDEALAALKAAPVTSHMISKALPADHGEALLRAGEIKPVDSAYLIGKVNLWWDEMVENRRGTEDDIPQWAEDPRRSFYHGWLEGRAEMNSNAIGPRDKYIRELEAQVQMLVSAANDGLTTGQREEVRKAFGFIKRIGLGAPANEHIAQMVKWANHGLEELDRFSPSPASQEDEGEGLGDAAKSGPRSSGVPSETDPASQAPVIAIAPAHRPYRVSLEGVGALAKWVVYGPIKKVERGYFMRRQDAEAHAEELNAVHAYAIKLALEITKTTNR